MQYTKVTFSYAFQEDYLEDILLQGLGDLGFETFDGMEAYIQTGLFDADALAAYLADFIASYGALVSVVSAEEVPDQNWNATWEAEHPMEELPDGVRIVPHCAFGAGHHETTGMLIEHIMRMKGSLAGQAVLDNGCGTGVLGIYAAKYGAEVTAVDIDDKSVVNTQENADLNGVRVDVRLGCVPPEGHYHLILSNIHKNILLEQMPLYAAYLAPGGLLMMSGFYEADVESLKCAAEAAELCPVDGDSRGEWHMITVRKNNE